jgi:hypothetical protein
VVNGSDCRQYNVMINITKLFIYLFNNVINGSGRRTSNVKINIVNEECRRVNLVWSDVSEERIASTFMVEKSASEEPA